MISPRFPTPLSTLLRAHKSRVSFTLPPPRLIQNRSLCTTTPTRTFQSRSFLNSYRLAVAVSLPVLAISLPLLSGEKTELKCETAVVGESVPAPVPVPQRQRPESILNLAELGFGTVAGICVGVFVKKGLKIAAFTLGGIFVLLQYFSSRSFISINWSALTNSYDFLITRRSGVAVGGNRAWGLWGTFVDFVAADVQGRATFVAGILLGFRLG